jgi:predicted metalloprotease with PDZ domain
MKTKNNNKVSKNKTRKTNRIKPSIKTLKIGYPLYASKKSYGDKILEYTKFNIILIKIK